MARNDPGGPFVSFAAFCENVLQDKDGVLSLIRIVDRIEVTAQGTNLPDQLPGVQIDLTLAVGLKSGAARGRHALILRPEAPSGQTLSEMRTDVNFEGEARGHNVIHSVRMKTAMEGVFWFDLFLDEARMERRLTRVPLEVRYQRLSTSGTPPQES